MKISGPPGVRTDDPMCASEPFWYASLNVRWSGPNPETVGLSALIPASGGGGMTVDLGGDAPTMYSDRDLLVVGHGNVVELIDVDAGTKTVFDMALYGITGASGRWWFAGTEREIICARSNLTGQTFAIGRASRAVSVVPNAPFGGVAGGVVTDILVKAGTLSVGGLDRDMVVRWSSRSTDPPSSGDAAVGPFGFEDWVPSDVNASGEIKLSRGSRVIGGGSTGYGFVVWTDTTAYLLAPRPDIYVFSEREISDHGLLSSGSWCEAEGRVWWFDQSRTLNVFDGGAVRQVPNPIKRSTLERLSDANAEFCSMTVQSEFGEVRLHYRDLTGRMREAVYNYALDCWYAFDLDRMTMTPEHSPRPTVGLRADGALLAYDIREAQASSFTRPVNWPVVPEASPPLVEIEPFDFYLMTNRIGAESLASGSLRVRNIVVPHTFANGLGQPALSDPDGITAAIQSFGSTDIRAAPVVDSLEAEVGEQIFPLRSGGKFIQFVISGEGVRTMIRFGVIDAEGEPGGEK